jgi:hypothetical protein
MTQRKDLATYSLYSAEPLYASFILGYLTETSHSDYPDGHGGHSFIRIGKQSPGVRTGGDTGYGIRGYGIRRGGATEPRRATEARQQINSRAISVPTHHAVFVTISAIN